MNNLIYRNGNYDGIRFSSTNSSLKIKGNTIAYNASYGINMYGSGNPDVNSNIIWGNGGSLSGSFSRVNYNCIQGGYSGTGNTDQNPQFRNANANDFHLTTASTYCIDKGDPNFNSIEQDVNGQDRAMDGDRNNIARVDMGSDEFYPYDLVRDEFVDFRDFSVFAQAWGKHTGEPNYNYLCNFYDDGAVDYIDYKDLYVFCEYWLCPADWEGIGGQGAYFADTGGGEMEMMMQEQEFSLAQTAFLAEQTVVSEAVAAQTEPQIAEVEPVVVDVNELLGWLDDLWQTDEEIGNSMSEEEYLEFKESIEESEQ
jgi:parallel beta-helix repeat protein